MTMSSYSAESDYDTYTDSSPDSISRPHINTLSSQHTVSDDTDAWSSKSASATAAVTAAASSVTANIEQHQVLYSYDDDDDDCHSMSIPLQQHAKSDDLKRRPVLLNHHHHHHHDGRNDSKFNASSGSLRSRSKGDSKYSSILSVSERRELVLKYCPIWYFHEDEEYFPMSLYEYPKHCTLMDLRSTPHQEMLHSPTWVQLSCMQRHDVSLYPSDKCLHGTLFNEQRMDNNELEQMYTVTERTADILIQYHIFFAYNGAFPACGCGPKLPTSAHNADWESIVVRLVPQHQQQLDDHDDGGDQTAKYELDSVYFGAHGSRDGMWVREADIDFSEGMRPHVYLSLNGHACYAKPYTYVRGIGCANDQCSDLGKVWKPNRLDTVEFDERHVAAQYGGYLGYPDHVSPANRQSRWRISSMVSTSNWRRWLCCLKEYLW
jgi:Vacuolar protein sorting-associated protein 62